MTKNEKVWFDKLQKLMDECPFDDSKYESYTIGDFDITFYDVKKHEAKREEYADDNYYPDECLICGNANAEVYLITTKFPIHSTAG